MIAKTIAAVFAVISLASGGYYLTANDAKVSSDCCTPACCVTCEPCCDDPKAPCCTPVCCPGPCCDDAAK
jgi:hypothetical protein